MKILIAEDEAGLRDVIAKKLRREKYEVDACRNGEEAYEHLTTADYDAAVLDIMMPVMDGLECVRRIRREKIMTPVIFLTAKDTVADRVTGLDIGANDYVVKPFSFDELFARIRAVTRTSRQSLSSVYTLADLKVDTESHVVTRAGNEIHLTAREYSLLEFMIINQGHILSRSRIEDHVWGYDYMGGTNVVDVYINYLRKKIDEDYEPKLIHTVRGIGFVMKEEAKDK